MISVDQVIKPTVRSKPVSQPYMVSLAVSHFETSSIGGALLHSDVSELEESQRFISLLFMWSINV